MCTLSTPPPADFDLLRKVIHDVARSARLNREDQEDFVQSAHLRFVERQYDVFTRFKGRSSLRTYLTAVVRRMLLDWRNAIRGKWRASAVARRLGPLAVGLERLVYRDGHTPEEAITILQSRGSVETAEVLAGLFAVIPQRARRRVVSPVTVDDECAVGFDDPLDAIDSRRVRRQVREALVGALRQLSAEDRRLIGVRYGGTQSLQSLADDEGADPKTLYRRVDRLVRQLRRAMVSAGVVHGAEGRTRQGAAAPVQLLAHLGRSSNQPLTGGA